jgi:hypothetical protein
MYDPNSNSNNTPPRLIYIPNDGTPTAQTKIQNYLMQGWKIVGAMSADQVSSDGAELGMRDFVVLQLLPYSSFASLIN